MSLKYDEYIESHKTNVYKAFLWLKDNLYNELFGGDETLRSQIEYNCQYAHDASKRDQFEYDAYDEYFYGSNRSYEVVQKFNRAWLEHIHKNPHHWQYWILINDNPDEGEIILDMPDIYIIEMICDWWSFSFNKGNLYEIFDWYDQRKKYMKLSEYTRMKVDNILSMIKNKLDESDYIYETS